jgi:hypothetical protein
VSTIKEAAESYFIGHLAGAEAALKLLARMTENDAGMALGGFASTLAQEIKEDKDTLVRLMNQLGFSSEGAGLQDLLARATESAAQMVLEVQAKSDDAVVSLVRLETLSLGIEGKRCLWTALAEVASEEPSLSTTDFDNLIKRAEAQREGVEQQRLKAARSALVGR